MSKPVLIVGHSDADGHVIVEHVRRNVERVPTFSVTTTIDPKRTMGHKMWTRLAELPEIDGADIVLFVDLMFAPASFAVEAHAFATFAASRPNKRFYVLDHHPLPLRLLSKAPNVRATYQRDVLDCTFGNATWLMAIAAMLEKQPTRFEGSEKPAHKQLAEGIRRAAAPGGPLPGAKLLALLRAECWGELIALGAEDKSNHKLPRGRRPKVWEASDVMLKLDKLATKLLRSDPSKSSESPRNPMSYDLEIAPSLIPSKAPVHIEGTSRAKHKKTAPARIDDLEAIVVLLELAAMTLSEKPRTSFTTEQLYDEACSIAGDDGTIDIEDVQIIVDKASFLKREKKNVFVLR